MTGTCAVRSEEARLVKSSVPSTRPASGPPSFIHPPLTPSPFHCISPPSFAHITPSGVASPPHLHRSLPQSQPFWQNASCQRTPLGEKRDCQGRGPRGPLRSELGGRRCWAGGTHSHGNTDSGPHCGEFGRGWMCAGWLRAEGRCSLGVVVLGPARLSDF